MVIFKYKVDDEVYTTDRKEMTPNDILVNAKFNPSQVYLIELEGEKETSFKDDPNKILHMHWSGNWNAQFHSVTNRDLICVM